jgi:transcriptional regulator with XRE-family HTH domain
MMKAKSNYRAVLTADLIDSTKNASKPWLEVLKRTLQSLGRTPLEWDIFRGDSFQLICDVQDALQYSLYLKSSMRQLEGIDVRIAIGIGAVDLPIENITEANGDAFLLSGRCFDNLRQNLAINTGNSKADEQLNLLLELALLQMDNWTDIEAQTLAPAFFDLQLTQLSLADKLSKSQSTISATLKRSGFDAVRKLEAYYRQNIWSWIP